MIQNALAGIVTASLLLALTSCSALSVSHPYKSGMAGNARFEAIDRELAEILSQNDIISAGVAIIRDGTVAWTGYYGEQAPGIPTSANTLFNVASITKTVTAETILRLAAHGKLDLDESIAPYWIDPDIADDLRHKALTARMALSHKSGFLNWRFFAAHGKLEFVNDPGSVFGYSGEGFEYVAKYAENKLEMPFDRLVQEFVLDPLGMTRTAFAIDPATFDRIARPEDDHGKFHGYYCRPSGWCRSEGQYSAADDMVISVTDYAKFLVSVMNDDQYEHETITDRIRVQTDMGAKSAVDCSAVERPNCPAAQGYGLGWEVLDYGDDQLVGHGGSDWSEVALAYFYTKSRDGIIVFLNAPNRLAGQAMPDVIRLLDPDSPMIARYLAWRKPRG